MLDKLKSYICTKYDISFQDIITQNRQSNVSTARKEFIWTLSKFTTLSSPEIGRIVKRDHSTVLHNVSRAEELIDGGYMNPEFDEKQDYEIDMVHINLARSLDKAFEAFKIALDVRLQKNPIDTLNRLTSSLSTPNKGE